MSGEVVARRLRAQRLAGNPLPGAAEVVGWMGAVQAQDYGAAKWALAQRAGGVTDDLVDRLVDEGAILRTHVMRSTWHFVLPADVRWMVGLTRAGRGRSSASRFRELELDEPTVERASLVFRAALTGGRHLTRPELGVALEAAGISARGQRLPHLLICAETDAVIVSGPRRGREFTYALLDERVPAGPELERPAALAELARRYFRSHGPARVRDFAWWSGLAAADARAAVERAGIPGRTPADGGDPWLDAEWEPVRARRRPPLAHLLPNFDEYTVAYRDREALVHPEHPLEPGLLSFGSVLANVVTVDGLVRGAWRRARARRAVQVDVRPFGWLEAPEAAAVAEAGRRLGVFLGCPVEMEGL
ncbi:MAG: winged helix DNA-binding domain-containing protein [Candidatus Dormibacteria bacterium]